MRSQALFTRDRAGSPVRLPLARASSRLPSMNVTPMLRLLALSLLVSVLSACGFHLRSKIALPSDLGPVKVSATDQYSPLARDLSVGLKAAGAIPADDPKAKVATLDIMSERWGDRPIALDEQGRAQEYSLRYAVVFRFLRADGSELVPQQVVELSRDYVRRGDQPDRRHLRARDPRRRAAPRHVRLDPAPHRQRGARRRPPRWRHACARRSPPAP